MSMQGPGGAEAAIQEPSAGALRSNRSTNKPKRNTWYTRAQRIHAEEAAERGEAKPKRPWWKFWA